MKPKSELTLAADAVQAEIKAYLAPLGFKCRSRNFNRKIGDDLVQVVNIWMGPYTSIVHGRISVNLGVYHQGISRVIQGDHARNPSWITEPDCFIRKRLGSIDDVDCWWDPTPSSAAEIIRLLKREEFEMFDRYSSLDKILKELYMTPDDRDDFDRPKRIVAAALRLLRGERDEAARLLYEQAEVSKESHPSHAEYVLELAQRLGLPHP